jgi:hypothetical protein
MDRWGSIPVRRKNFFVFTASPSVLGFTQLAIRCLQGAFSLELKRPGSEADHSLPSITEVKNFAIKGELYVTL